jgi:hypothetical protein
MTVALITLNLIALGALGLTAFYGHHIPQGGGALGRHLLLGLVATLLAVFAQVMTFFYFIGMSSTIRKSVEETVLGHELLRQSRMLKSQVFPWAAGAMGLLMLTFILGGAAHTRVLPGWVHGGLGYFSVAVAAAAFVQEVHLLFRLNYLVNEFNRTWAGETGARQPSTSA